MASSNVGGHVAVFPFPFSSNPGSLLQFSRKLAASAPGVRVSYFATEESAAALWSLSVEGNDGVDVRRMDDGLKGESAATLSLFERIRRFKEAAGEGFRRSMVAAEDETRVPISCVVSDAFLSFVCPAIADERAVNWVALWTSSAAALVVHMYTEELRTEIQAQGGLDACKDKTVDSYIPGFPPIPIRCLASEVVVDDLSSCPVAQILHQMSSKLPKAAAVAINSVDSLEAAATKTLNSAFGGIFMAAGPFSLAHLLPQTSWRVAAKDPEGCIRWLDTQAAASVVYISFGTAFTPSEEELRALAEALEEGRVPFLWSLPERLRGWVPYQGFKKGKLVAWAPQTSVLAHTAVGAQLTHCGWNSVTESVASGVPMICRALPMADQRFNERLVVDLWGIGVAVEGGKLTRTSVAAVVERVFEGAAVRNRIREMRRLFQEAAAEPHGSSVQNLNKFINIIINTST